MSAREAGGTTLLGTRMRIKFVVHEVFYRPSVNLSSSFVLFLLCWLPFASFCIRDLMLIICSQASHLFYCRRLRLQPFASSLPVLDTTAVESLAVLSLLGHWHQRPPFDAKLYSAYWRDRQTRRSISHFCKGMRIGGGENAQ